MVDGFLKRYLRDPGEAFALVVFLCVFRVLPVDVASALGGLIGRTIGPRLRVTRRTHANLSLIYPEKDARERGAIVREMWDNLGRTVAEFPHLGRMSRRGSTHVEFVDSGPLLALAAQGSPAILVGAHMANWELMSVYLSSVGLDVTSIARTMNNRISEVVIEKYRNSCGGARIDKDKQGTRQAITVLRHGGVLGVLADQKMNNGISAQLMGHVAMTATGPAQLSIQFDCPVIPVRIERLRGTRFRIRCYPAIETPRTGDKQSDVVVLTQRINDVLGQWIQERPGQWLWLHRRWPEKTHGSDIDAPTIARQGDQSSSWVGPRAAGQNWSQRSDTQPKS